jgi:nucleotide-binding universal stress UspA family protein
MPAWKQIVVGVDGSEYSGNALRWAAEEAGHHRAQLLVVTTWTALPPPIAYPFGGFAAPSDEPPAEAASRALERFLEDALGQDRLVDTQTYASAGHPAEVLVRFSATADLVVVGARGQSGFSGWLLGSVSRQVAVHAACSVVVVR